MTAPAQDWRDEHNPVNIPLLLKAVSWVEEQAALPVVDRQWDQERWRFPNERRSQPRSCGTTYCVAGWLGQNADPRYAQSSEVDGVHVGDFAQRLLGLSFSQSGRLFHAENTAADVRRIAEDIAGCPL